MRKYIFIGIIIVGLSIAGITMAKVVYKDLTTRLNESGQLYAPSLDSNNLGVVKFVDDGKTCYVSFAKVNDKAVDTGIFCMK